MSYFLPTIPRNDGEQKRLHYSLIADSMPYIPNVFDIISAEIIL
jgi:hypothetical protein